MPLSTLLIVGGSWLLILIVTVWRVVTWRDGGDE
jgi:hypothetical protein